MFSLINKSIAAIAVAGLSTLLFVAVASAQTPSQRFEQRIDIRQDRQAARIDAGVASGQLSAREQARLERQQAGSERLEQRIEADGRITRREARQMEHVLDRNSRAIARQKHDRQQRPAPGGGN
jgi:hypothetical protein